MLALYSFLKIVRIEGLDRMQLIIIVEDSKEQLIERHQGFSKFGNSKNAAESSWMWSHVGLYMMHIGFDVVCGK